MKRLSTPVLFPFLLAAYPVIALLAQNLGQLELHAGLRALIFSLLAAAVLFLLARLLLRDSQRASLLVALVLLLFFTYGHVYDLIEDLSVSNILIGRHRYLILLYFACFAVGTAAILRIQRRLDGLNQALNLIGMVALAFPVAQILIFTVQSSTLTDPLRNINASAAAENLSVSQEQPPPDIYYIILDAYSRDDVLQRVFDYDNSQFLSQMEAIGFTVARCSQSNYAQTELSLASSLNFNYIDALRGDSNQGGQEKAFLWKAIKGNAVRNVLEELGYTFVAFETGYNWTQIEDADFYLTPHTTRLEELEIFGGLTDFEFLLAKTTVALIGLDAVAALPPKVGQTVQYPLNRHRDRILFDLEKLPAIPHAIQSPKFVFAHIVIPHDPFVFGLHGEPIAIRDPDEGTYRAAYPGQVEYINQRISEIAGEIIASSDRPPVIIIQGDHGATNLSREDRMKNLSLYYLPDGGNRQLYESITPVNNFRVVFNAYLNGHYELLPDQSYYSTYDDPFNFTLIPPSGERCASAP
jgi:hypothetical protein